MCSLGAESGRCRGAKSEANKCRADRKGLMGGKTAATVLADTCNRGKNGVAAALSSRQIEFSARGRGGTRDRRGLAGFARPISIKFLPRGNDAVFVYSRDASPSRSPCPEPSYVNF